MNQSQKSYSLQILFVLAMVVFATTGCFLFQPVIGNVFSNITPGLGMSESSATPSDVAKAWIDGLFNADGQAMRDNMCKSQRAAITDEVVNQLDASLLGAGATIDTAGITYTFNDATSMVTIGGNLKVTVSGQSVDVPMTSFPLAEIPVVNEDGRWFVCLSLNDVMGG